VRRPRFRSLATFVGKAFVFAMAALLIVLGAALASIETGWAKNRLRAFIVAQANQYLTATLEIGRLQGSLLRGIELGDIRLSRDDEVLIAIDEVSVAYSLRELWQSGTVIRRITLTRRDRGGPTTRRTLEPRRADQA
jgi:hypothetical protein